MKLSKDKVREIFMAHGFTVKDGQTDLKPYVYAAAEALAEAAVQAEREGAEPFGWYFMDDPKVYTMPGSGFRVGPDRPADTLHASPLYLHPPQASATVPEGMVLVPREPTERMLDHAVSFALNVGPAQSGGWTEYSRRMWETMVIAATSQQDADKAQGVG